jgi:hypothetical protein
VGQSDYDLIAIVEMPGNVEAEAVAAMKKAAKSGYATPSHAAHA